MVFENEDSADLLKRASVQTMRTVEEEEVDIDVATTSEFPQPRRTSQRLSRRHIRNDSLSMSATEPIAASEIVDDQGRPPSEHLDVSPMNRETNNIEGHSTEQNFSSDGEVVSEPATTSSSETGTNATAPPRADRPLSSGQQSERRSSSRQSLRLSNRLSGSELRSRLAQHVLSTQSNDNGYFETHHGSTTENSLPELALSGATSRRRGTGATMSGSTRLSDRSLSGANLPLGSIPESSLPFGDPEMEIRAVEEANAAAAARSSPDGGIASTSSNALESSNSPMDDSDTCNDPECPCNIPSALPPQRTATNYTREIYESGSFVFTDESPREIKAEPSGDVHGARQPSQAQISAFPQVRRRVTSFFAKIRSKSVVSSTASSIHGSTSDVGFDQFDSVATGEYDSDDYPEAEKEEEEVVEEAWQVPALSNAASLEALQQHFTTAINDKRPTCTAVRLHDKANFTTLSALLRSVRWAEGVRRVVVEGHIPVPSLQLKTSGQGAAQPLLLERRKGCDKVTMTNGAWFPSVFYPELCVRTGKWYFEVSVLRMTHGLFQIGFVDKSFTLNGSLRAFDHGVGDCTRSWAFDGGRRCTWHNGLDSPWGEMFNGRQGAVIGCAVDADAKSIYFSFRGSWDAPMGKAFENVDAPGGLIPAISAHTRSSAILNLGQSSFKYAPPDESFRPFFEFALEREMANIPMHLDKALPTPERPSHLTHLTLASTDLNAALILCLVEDKYSDLSSLTHLNLEGNNLGSDIGSLKALIKVLREKAPKLKSLNMRNNGLSVDGIRTLSPLLTRLRVLHLDNNRLLGYKGGASVASVMAKGTQLRELTLCGNFLGDSGGIAVLEAVRSSNILSSLSLERNDLGKTFAGELEQFLEEHSGLKKLNLRSNPGLGTVASDILAAAVHLEDLDLGRLGLGAKDVKSIIASAVAGPAPLKLLRLGLAGNKFGLDGYSELVKALGRSPRRHGSKRKSSSGSSTSKSRVHGSRIIALDLSSNGLTESEYLDLISTVVATQKLKECDLSGNVNVGQSIALHIADLLESEEEVIFPAFNLSGTNVGTATAKAIFMTGRLRNRRGLSEGHALALLFQRAWPVTCKELPMFTRLFKRLESSKVVSKNDLRPELRIQGDFVAKPESGASTIDDLELPRRVRVMGDATFVSCAEPVFDRLEAFSVEGLLWIQNCPQITSIPEYVQLGRSLVVSNTPITSIRVTPMNASRELDLVHLMDLEELTHIEDHVRVATMRIEHCTKLSRLSPQSVRVGLSLSDCPNMHQVPDLKLQVLELKRCDLLSSIKATVTRSLVVVGLPLLASIPGFRLKSIELEHCPKLEKVSAQASDKLTIVSCPLISKLPAEKRLRHLILNRCNSIKLPKTLVVKSSCFIAYCRLISDLPTGFSKIRDMIRITGCTIKELPAMCRAETVELRHCNELQRLGDGVTPQFLLVTGCRKITAIEDYNVLSKAKSKLNGSSDNRLDEHAGWELLRCRSLSRLPKVGVLDALDISQCPALTEIDPQLQIQNLDISDCSGLTRFGGSQEFPRESETLCIENCSNLVVLEHLQVKDLFINNCSSFNTLAPSVSVSTLLNLSLLPSLTTLPIFLPENTKTIELTTTGIRPVRLDELERVARRHGNEFEWYDSDGYEYDFSENQDIGFKTVDEAVTFWGDLSKYDMKGIELGRIVPEYYKDGLLKFLSKLRTSAEFQREETREGLARRIVEVLETINDDEYSREEILLRCVDSVDRCNDKPIWALNQITLTTLISKARGNRKKLRDLGHSIMRLDVVHEHAKNKIAELGSQGEVDDVCVYLKYEISLRESLDLPVSAQHMLFPSYIKIKKSELAATREAAAAITDEDLEIWLSAWPEWQRQLRLEAAEAVTWQDLETTTVTKRISLSLTTFSGDPMSNPVLVGKRGPWCFEELIDRWVATGMDFANVKLDPGEFISKLRKIEV